MNIGLFIAIGLFVVLPGLLLVLGARRLKNLIHESGGVLILIGALFILVHLVSESLTYYHSFFGSAESLAAYALNWGWISPVTEYIGLVLIASGMLILKKN